MSDWIEGQSSVVIDRRQELAAQPGLHAILIGVSDYQFLPDYDQPPDPTKLRFSKLSGPGFTVKAVFDWITASTTRLAQPLKSCRVLLTPHREELPRLKDLRGALPASRQNVVQALYDWRQDACDFPGSMTLLYFCGHGMQNGGEDVVLTFSDFQGRYAPKLTYCAEFSNIKLGMVPCPALTNIARTQFYFVDACRNYPFELRDFEDPAVPRVFDIPTDRNDDREAPVLFGAPPTKMSMGRLGGVSVLGEAFIHAVSHAAEERDGPNGQERWKVDAVSLKRGIDRYIQRKNLQQKVQPAGSPGQPVLCWLDDPPAVDIECAIEPAALHPTILNGVTLQNVDPPAVVLATQYCAKQALFTAEIPAGYYRVHVNGPAVQFQSRVEMVDQSLKLPWRSVAPALAAPAPAAPAPAAPGPGGHDHV